MMKYRYLIIFVLTLVLLIGGLVIFKNSAVKEDPENATEMETQQTVSELSPGPSVPPPADELAYICEKGRSAYEVLHSRAKVDYKESSLGPLVTGINNRSQGDGKFWLYSVDGKEATVGAALYICTGMEEIKWELK